MRSLAILVATVLLTAAGCGTTPPAPARPASPVGFPAGSGDGDPSPGTSPGPLTLEQCIAEGLVRNPGIAVRRQEEEAARARQDFARAERLPTANAVASVRHTLDDQRLLPASAPTDPGVWSENLAGGDLVVALPLYTGGRLTNEIRAADLLARASGHRLSRTREELVFDVTSLFASILAERRVIDAVGFSRRALREHLKLVEDLIAADRASEVDRLRIRVRLADVEQRLVVEENRLAIERRALASLLGREGAVEVSGELPAAVPDAELQVSLREAAERREDRLAAAAEVEAARARLEIARSGGRPSVSLVGSYGGRLAFGGTTRQPGADSPADTGQLGITVDVPLFTGGRVVARVREQAALVRAREEALRELDLRIHLEVETAVLDIAAARARVAATRDSIAEAAEALRIEREKHALGRGAITDVLDAQAAQLDAETNYDRALASLMTSRARLDLTTGRMR